MKDSKWDLYKELRRLSPSEARYIKEYGLPSIQFDYLNDGIHVESHCTLAWVWHTQYVLYTLMYDNAHEDVCFQSPTYDPDGLFQYAEREAVRLTSIIYKNKGLRTIVMSVLCLLGFNYLVSNPTILLDLLVRPSDY